MSYSMLNSGMNGVAYHRAVPLQNAVTTNISPYIPFSPPNAVFPCPSHQLVPISALYPPHPIFPLDPLHAATSCPTHQYQHVNAPSAITTATTFQPKAYSLPPTGEVLQQAQPRSKPEENRDGLLALADQCIRSSSSSTDAPLAQLRNALLLVSEGETCVTKLTGVIVAQHRVKCELKDNTTMCASDGTRAAVSQIQLLTERVLK